MNWLGSLREWLDRPRYTTARSGCAVFEPTPITVADTMPTEIPEAAASPEPFFDIFQWRLCCGVCGEPFRQEIAFTHHHPGDAASTPSATTPGEPGE